jgi:hypothetical protein
MTLTQRLWDYFNRVSAPFDIPELHMGKPEPAGSQQELFPATQEDITQRQAVDARKTQVYGTMIRANNAHVERHYGQAGMVTLTNDQSAPLLTEDQIAFLQSKHCEVSFFDPDASGV